MTGTFNGIAGILFVVYVVRVVLIAGNGEQLSAAVRKDAPNILPWLISVLVLFGAWNARGYLGPASKTVGIVIVTAGIGLLITKSDTLKKSIDDAVSLFGFGKKGVQ